MATPNTDMKTSSFSDSLAHFALSSSCSRSIRLRVRPRRRAAPTGEVAARSRRRRGSSVDTFSIRAFAHTDAALRGRCDLAAGDPRRRRGGAATEPRTIRAGAAAAARPRATRLTRLTLSRRQSPSAARGRNQPCTARRVEGVEWMAGAGARAASASCSAFDGPKRPFSSVGGRNAVRDVRPACCDGL